MVASGVASKGLDFNDIQHVIIFSMPKEIEDYVHQIGRTGRSGKTGIATTFVNMNTPEQTLLDLKYLLMEAGQKYVPSRPSWPTVRLIALLSGFLPSCKLSKIRAQHRAAPSRDVRSVVVSDTVSRIVQSWKIHSGGRWLLIVRQRVEVDIDYFIGSGSFPSPHFVFLCACTISCSLFVAVFCLDHFKSHPLLFTDHTMISTMVNVSTRILSNILHAEQ